MRKQAGVMHPIYSSLANKLKQFACCKNVLIDFLTRLNSKDYLVKCIFSQEEANKQLPYMIQYWKKTHQTSRHGLKKESCLHSQKIRWALSHLFKKLYLFSR